MTIQLNEENGGKLINVSVSGKLEKTDYEQFVPAFERLAMVGEKRWQHGMAVFCTPFRKANIHFYFNHDAATEARVWLGEG